MGLLLDRYDGISPLSRDAYGGAAGASYRRQEESYGRALRLLKHAARRGDARSALAEIATRDQATQQGYQVGGIQSADRRLDDARRFAGSLSARAQAQEEAAGVQELGNEEARADLGLGAGAAGRGLSSGAAGSGLGAGRAGYGLSGRGLTAGTPGLDAQRERGIGGMSPGAGATPSSGFSNFITGGGANQPARLKPTEYEPVTSGEEGEEASLRALGRPRLADLRHAGSEGEEEDALRNGQEAARSPGGPEPGFSRSRLISPRLPVGPDQAGESRSSLQSRVSRPSGENFPGSGKLKPLEPRDTGGGFGEEGGPFAPPPGLTEEALRAKEGLRGKTLSTRSPIPSLGLTGDALLAKEEMRTRVVSAFPATVRKQLDEYVSTRDKVKKEKLGKKLLQYLEGE